MKLADADVVQELGELRHGRREWVEVWAGRLGRGRAAPHPIDGDHPYAGDRLGLHPQRFRLPAAVQTDDDGEWLLMLL